MLFLGRRFLIKEFQTLFKTAFSSFSINAIGVIDFTTTTLCKRSLKKLMLDTRQKTTFSFNDKMD